MGHFCGGTIINNCYILSAAHCDVDGDRSKFVVLGTIYRTGEHGGVTHDVTRVINHPNYNPETSENDINLLRVSPYITYNAAVQPMPIAAHAAQSGDAVVSGWGHLEYEGEFPEILQFFNTQIISDEECYEELGGSRFIVSNLTICIRNPEGQGICQGDSGGPLVHNGGLHGVASWVVTPCGTAAPDVYARVSAYVSWILANAV
uniref:Uncharacterized protein n=1 Tax=Anopheles atroparvus TaxID=41427 RepID=A0A182ILS6_ANOAO